MYDPPVLVKKCFPESFCKHLVAHLDSRQGVDSGVYDSDTKSATVNNYHRSSTAIIASPEVYGEVDTLMGMIVNAQLGLTLARKAELCEPLQFLKYDESKKGHFLAHTDNAYYDARGRFIHAAPNRHITCIAYINEDYEGGELILNSVKDDYGNQIIMRPKVGQVVIFPSDLRFTHEVKPVTKGRRYSIVGWYNLK